MLSVLLTYSSLTDNPGHADEQHHTPDVQHTAHLPRQRKLLYWCTTKETL